MRQKPATRLDYLDSLRGLAAFSVVIYHFIGWHWKDQLGVKISFTFFNGSDAVSFFFVLSGFVLSYKYFRKDIPIKMPFYFYKRVMRLYPAFIVTVLLNYCYWNRVSIMNGDILFILKDIFWNNSQQLWHELIMVRSYHKFYVPGWTLNVELSFSLFIPVLIYAARANIRMIWWLLPICLLMGHYISIFAFHFLIGILLAYYYPQIAATDYKSTKLYQFKYPIGLLLFLLYSLRHWDQVYYFGNFYHHYIREFLLIDFFHFSAIASAIIIYWVICSETAQRWLNKSLFLFLGKISYSMYLTHWLIVVYIMEHWEQLIAYFPNFYIGFGSLLTIAILLTILSSILMYNFVEKPFIKWSNKYRLWEKYE
jgi:peptidoglycan/LPS O-acetylase OafA/YrhL